MVRLSRDPNCKCKILLPAEVRIWCDHCLTEGPLPGSGSDPEAIRAVEQANRSSKDD